MSIATLPGITTRTITTSRLRTRVLFSGPDDGLPVLFLHGNTSNATWWEETMTALPAGFRGICPDQRGYGEADPQAKIDATRGMGDLADDAVALLDALEIKHAHVVGNSMGGAVIWRMMVTAPARLRSVVLVAPGSPYGFGGTKDVQGTPCYPDYAGSGGGLTNPELLHRLQDGDRTLESQFSPRAVLRTLIVKGPFIPAREDELVEGMLSLHIGPQDIPGGSQTSPNWPYFAPGEWGATNALSPKYADDIQGILAGEPKCHILWVRGDSDLLVSDQAASDPAVAGMMGLIPGWPGPEVFPPQPMLAQTRDVLERYAAAGGSYEEIVFPESAHIPYIEKPREFNRVFHQHLQQQESK